MSEQAAVERYRAARDAFLVAGGKADAAFARYFAKRQAGERTNGAAWQRLENRANELSAELASAEIEAYAAGVDPWMVDRADRVESLPR